MFKNVDFSVVLINPIDNYICKRKFAFMYCLVPVLCIKTAGSLNGNVDLTLQMKVNVVHNDFQNSTKLLPQVLKS